MKRFLTALLLISALLAALVLPAAAADGIAGRYNAVSCVKDGTSYKCEDEYLILSEDGSGGSAAAYIRSHTKRAAFEAGNQRDMVEIVSELP